MADITPVQIVMANRSRTPTHEELAGQVTALARTVAGLGQQADWNGTVSAGNVSAIGGRLPAPGLSGPSRTLDAPFQISPSSPALVVYTIEMVVNAGLLVTQNAAVALLVDSSSPPAQMVSAINQQVVGLTITARKILIGWVPAGYWVNLQSTLTNGASANIIAQLEVVFAG